LLLQFSVPLGMQIVDFNFVSIITSHNSLFKFVRFSSSQIVCVWGQQSE
jgi:hypothetical protein